MPESYNDGFESLIYFIFLFFFATMMFGCFCSLITTKAISIKYGFHLKKFINIANWTKTFNKPQNVLKN